jgi:hypothetical protein
LNLLWKRIVSFNKSNWERDLVNVLSVTNPTYSYIFLYYACNHCCKTFSSLCIFNNHTRVHKERDLANVLSVIRTFSQAGSLYRHMKVHSDERPLMWPPSLTHFSKILFVQVVECDNNFYYTFLLIRPCNHHGNVITGHSSLTMI